MEQGMPEHGRSEGNSSQPAADRREPVEAVHELLARHLPARDVRAITRLGEGLDHVAWDVDGELVIRQGKEPDRAGRHRHVLREEGVLRLAAQLSPLPVPEVVFTDAEAGVLAYLRLPGVPLSEFPVADPGPLALALGRFTGMLHRAPLEGLERVVDRDDYPLPSWREDAERDYDGIREGLPPADRPLVEDFLGRPPPPEPPRVAFCHNDLGSEHVLVDMATGAITGVIDWSDAAIADPARDFALVYRDLGPELLDIALTAYGSRLDASDRERAVFYARCKLLEDIAYGLRTGRRRYAEAGKARLTRVFS
jgi:aminoglycoside phosphotransferase (APT) family kinase protein